MHQPLCGIPDDIAERLLAVDAQQMLQYAQEGTLRRLVGHLRETEKGRESEVRVRIE